MTVSNQVDDIRASAVEHHDAAATYFDEQYKQMEKDSFATAFLYGRKKIDDLLYPTLTSFPKDSRVLDIGCGTGEQLRRCRELGYEVSGVEPAPQLRALAQKHNPGVQIQDGSITDLPLDDDSFDFVINLEVLRYLHSEDIDKAYREMLRVLKPGGKMFLTLVNLYAWDGFFIFTQLKTLGLKLAGRSMPTHCEFVTPSRIRREFSRHGVSDVECHGRLFGPIRMAYFVNKSLGKIAAKTLEAFDDSFCKMTWTTAFAAHLIVVATKPK